MNEVTKGKFSIGFLRRLVELLSEGKVRLEDFKKFEEGGFVKYEKEGLVGSPPRAILEAWIEAKKDSSGMLVAWTLLGFSSYIEAHEDGAIEIYSQGMVDINLHISLAIQPLFDRELKEAEKIGDKEKYDELVQKWIEKTKEIIMGLSEGKDFEECIDMEDKRLRKTLSLLRMIALYIKYVRKIAERISGKYGFEVKHYLKPHEDWDFFYSAFNSSGMSEDELLEEIKKRADAVREAQCLGVPGISKRYLNDLRKKLRSVKKLED
jgi:hypothetical protein